jgi:hypothetical protein
MLQVYDGPYKEDLAASAAIYKTMQAVEWNALLKKVDQAYCGWRVPSAVLFGNSVRSNLPIMCCSAKPQAVPVYWVLY